MQQNRKNIGENIFDLSIEDTRWSQKHVEIISTLRLSGNRNKYPLCKDCKFPGAVPIAYIVQYPEIDYSPGNKIISESDK